LSTHIAAVDQHFLNGSQVLHRFINRAFKSMTLPRR
jgi:hypothetical protein